MNWIHREHNCESLFLLALRALLDVNIQLTIWENARFSFEIPLVKNSILLYCSSLALYFIAAHWFVVDRRTEVG